MSNTSTEEEKAKKREIQKKIKEIDASIAVLVKEQQDTIPKTDRETAETPKNISTEVEGLTAYQFTKQIEGASYNKFVSCGRQAISHLNMNLKTSVDERDWKDAIRNNGERITMKELSKRSLLVDYQNLSQTQNSTHEDIERAKNIQTNTTNDGLNPTDAYMLKEDYDITILQEALVDRGFIKGGTYFLVNVYQPNDPEYRDKIFENFKRDQSCFDTRPYILIGDGSHWTCAIVQKSKKVLYMDSMSEKPVVYEDEEAFYNKQNLKYKTYIGTFSHIDISTIIEEKVKEFVIENLVENIRLNKDELIQLKDDELTKNDGKIEKVNFFKDFFGNNIADKIVTPESDYAVFEDSKRYENSKQKVEQFLNSIDNIKKIISKRSRGNGRKIEVLKEKKKTLDINGVDDTVSKKINSHTIDDVDDFDFGGTDVINEAIEEVDEMMFINEDQDEDSDEDDDLEFLSRETIDDANDAEIENKVRDEFSYFQIPGSQVNDQLINNLIKEIKNNTLKGDLRTLYKKHKTEQEKKEEAEEVDKIEKKAEAKENSQRLLNKVKTFISNPFKGGRKTRRKNIKTRSIRRGRWTRRRR